MKRLPAIALGFLLAIGLPALAATFNLFAPVTGILKGNASTYVTTAAASSDVLALWTGTCDATTYLRGDGACAAAGGGGGTLGLSDSSASTPALYFTNDTNTGIANEGGTPNTLDLVTDGVARIHVQTNNITLDAGGSTDEIAISSGAVAIGATLTVDGVALTPSFGLLTIPGTAGNGCAAASQTGTGYYNLVGAAVFFYLNVTCSTSDAVTWQIGPSVFPFGVRPTNAATVSLVATDNGGATYSVGTGVIGTGGAFTASLATAGGGWTASGAKTVNLQGYFNTAQ